MTHELEGPNHLGKPNLLIVASSRARKGPSSPLLRLVRDHVETLRLFSIHTTAGTGRRILGTGMFQPTEIQLHKPGKDGGIAQLAAMVARRQVEAAILLLDPSDPWSDAVENRALKRVLIQLRVHLMTTYTAAQRWLTLEAPRQGSTRENGEAVQGWHLTEWRNGEKNISDTGDVVSLPIQKRTLALISHDRKKQEMVLFVNETASLLAEHQRILTTGTTGWLLRLLFADEASELLLIRELRARKLDERLESVLEEILVELDQRPRKAELEPMLRRVRETMRLARNNPFVEKVIPLPSGPLGGDVLIADEVLSNRCHSIIFFHDPLTAHPHNDDIRLLEHTSQLPSVFCECISDFISAKRWTDGLAFERQSAAIVSCNLAQELRQVYRLHEVVLAERNTDEDGDALGFDLVRACAGYFHQRLIDLMGTRDKVHIGLGWGWGPSHILEEIKALKQRGLLETADRICHSPSWSPLIGALTPEVTKREASITAQDFCRFYGGKIEGFPCAAFVRRSGDIPSPAQELIAKLETAELILTSASPWDAETADSLYRDTGVNPKYFPPPGDGVGLMSGIVFHERGNPVRQDYEVVGLKAEGFRSLAARGAVILLCGGKRRHTVVHALLRAHLVSTLVTTTGTAEWLLSLADPRYGPSELVTA